MLACSNWFSLFFSDFYAIFGTLRSQCCDGYCYAGFDFVPKIIFKKSLKIIIFWWNFHVFLQVKIQMSVANNFFVFLCFFLIFSQTKWRKNLQNVVKFLCSGTWFKIRALHIGQNFHADRLRQSILWSETGNPSKITAKVGGVSHFEDQNNC